MARYRRHVPLARLRPHPVGRAPGLRHVSAISDSRFRGRWVSMRPTSTATAGSICLAGSYNDPVSGHRDMGLVIFWGGRDGYRHSDAQWLPGFSPLGRTVADFDGDGYLDLVSPQHSGELTREDLACHIYWGSAIGLCHAPPHDAFLRLGQRHDGGRLQRRRADRPRGQCPHSARRSSHAVSHLLQRRAADSRIRPFKSYRRTAHT